MGLGLRALRYDPTSRVQRFGSNEHMSGLNNSKKGATVIFESRPEPLNTEPLNGEPKSLTGI